MKIVSQFSSIEGGPAQTIAALLWRGLLTATQKCVFRTLVGSVSLCFLAEIALASPRTDAPAEWDATAAARLPAQIVAPAGSDSLGGMRASAGVVQPAIVRPALEAVQLTAEPSGRITLPQIPNFSTVYAGRLAAQTGTGSVLFFSLDPDLQRFSESLVREARAPHIAIVAIEPDTGKILAMADKSSLGGPGFKGLTVHTGFPAASLFKLVTAAAALERGAIGPESRIQFRGGTYTLERWNFFPNPRRDHRFMTVGDALARSCNPVFGRIALNYLEPEGLRRYAKNFGFNAALPFDSPLPTSYAVIPEDSYELSRTAAGFGEVRISPVHAAAMMAGIVNHGLMPRPSYLEKIVAPSGKVLFQAESAAVQRLMEPQTADSLVEMMELTTTVGTSRKAFTYRQQPVLGAVRVAAKTGTLRGDNPVGVNNWFVGAAPVGQPRIAVSVIVVNAETIDTKASYIGRRVIQSYLGLPDITPKVVYRPKNRALHIRKPKHSNVRRGSVKPAAAVKKKSRTTAAKKSGQKKAATKSKK